MISREPSNTDRPFAANRNSDPEEDMTFRTLSPTGEAVPQLGVSPGAECIPVDDPRNRGKCREDLRVLGELSSPASETVCSLRASSRAGMVLLIVIGCLVFTMIVFASMIDRVHRESRLTARNSVNENLYQLASAIGRLTIRKLQRKIENVDKTTDKDIYDAIFAGTALKNITFSDVDGLDVILKLKERYKDLDSKVKYSLEFDGGFTFQSGQDIAGLEAAPMERQGSIVVEVTVTANRHSKTCKMIKRFFLVRLLPAPFHKFTLFVTRGAEIPQNIVNSLDNIGDDGKCTDSRPPLVIVNCSTDSLSDKNRINFSTNLSNANFINQKDPILNGWIYLGGEGTPRTGLPSDRNLVLNCCSGDKGPIDSGYVGEGFHFYYESTSNGWLGSAQWCDWLNRSQYLKSSAGQVMMTFVDYGFFSKMVKPFGNPSTVLSFNGRELFKPFIEYMEKDPKNAAEGLKFGSRLHLYGSPDKCTPTLVFGQVRRRYMRTFAFYFSSFSKVYPLRLFGQNEWEGDKASLLGFWEQELEPWVAAKDPANYAGTALASSVGDMLNNEMKYPVYRGPDSANGLVPLHPMFYDQPYNQGLVNLRNPKDPGKTFDECMNEVSGPYGNPDKLAKKDYEMKNDPQMHFNGRLREISLPPKYLGQRTSYYVTEGNSELLLSKCQFLIDKKIFLPASGGNPNRLFLNQIIRIKQPFTIDVPVEVVKGGIIICDERIKINAPITNPFLSSTSSPGSNNASRFGLLTLATNKNIEIAAYTKGSGQIYPELHAYLIAMNGVNGQIVTNGPLHIKGGVAVDQLDKPQSSGPGNGNLLQNGGIIEWGFDPTEIADGRDLSERDYYGIAMGPRDVEVVEEE
ncbi:MAG: hypothetical protein WA705_01320 [Candidatus Ozemobacteraceae bacterium]